jgi:hypothetical protein
VGHVLSMAKTSLNFHFLEPYTLQYGNSFLPYFNVLYTFMLNLFVVYILDENNMFLHSSTIFEPFSQGEKKF